MFEIQRNFDTLSLAEIHAAIAYYLHNKEAVDRYIAGPVSRELQYRMTDAMKC
jgi:hypothetical protein